MSRGFTQTLHQRWQNVYGKMFIILVIREMLIKITLLYYIPFTSVQSLSCVRLCDPMKCSLKIKYDKTQCWWECQAIGPFVHRGWKCIMVQPLWKRVYQLLIELKTWLPYGFSDPTSKQLLRKMKTYSHMVFLSLPLLNPHDSQCWRHPPNRHAFMHKIQCDLCNLFDKFWK